MKKNPNAKIQKILEFVRQKHPITNPNPGFINQLMSWDHKIKKDLWEKNEEDIKDLMKPKIRPMQILRIQADPNYIPPVLKGTPTANKIYDTPIPSTQ